MRKRTWIPILAGTAIVLGILWAYHAWQEHAIAAAAVPATLGLPTSSTQFTTELARAESEALGYRNPTRGLARLGRLYHANGYFDEAVSCYQGLAALEPDAARWPHLVANILAGFGRIDEARPWQERAARLAPQDPAVRLRLAEMQLKNNQAGAAATTYHAVLQHDPANVYALLGLARCDMAAGNWTAARERLQSAVKLRPDFSGGWALLATVCEHLNDVPTRDEARRRAQQLGRYRDFPDPWLDELTDSCFDAYQLSVAAGVAGHDARARRLIERAIALDPNNGTYHRQLAKVLRVGRDPAGARRELETAVALSPTDAESWAALVELLIEQKDGRAASAAITTGLNHCPQSGYLHFANGNRLDALGQPAAAEVEFKTAKKIQPHESRAYVRLGALYVQQGRMTDALAEMHAALNVEPGNSHIMVLLARLYIMVPDETEARRWIQEFRQRTPGRGDDLTMLEQLFREQFGHAL